VLLAADPPDVAEVREALGDIEHDSERGGRVIQRLRALFNKTGQERSRLQLNDLIEETLDLLRSEFVLKGISTQVHLEPKLPEVLGNRIELQQVVLNLVVNAMEAMRECEPAQRHLEIATGCGGPAKIRASVRDSGSGIRVEPISRLFEPFFTTKASGMGMGLAISHSILEAHDGSLGAANNPDRGATFHFTLPIHHGGEA
jgi:signal transduction histidine kinase